MLFSEALGNPLQYQQTPYFTAMQFEDQQLNWLRSDMLRATETSSSEPPRLRGTATNPHKRSTSLVRREQCRINQARYRRTQKEKERHLQGAVEQLRQEVDALQHEQQSITARTACKWDSWLVVIETFNLLSSCLQYPWLADIASGPATMQHSLTVVQESLPSDVSIGDQCGVDAVIQHLRDYSKFFGRPVSTLQRVDAEAPGVMTATALLSFTASDATLSRAFPGLAGDEQVRRQLLDRRLRCSLTMQFFFDQDTRRVERVETSTDVVSVLVGALKSVRALPGCVPQLE